MLINNTHIFNITPYDTKVFNEDVLSYLNVDQQGDVVTAETWNALWKSFYNFTYHIDLHLKELLGKDEDGVLIRLIEDHNVLAQEHSDIKNKQHNLEVSFADLNERLEQSLNYVAQIKDIYRALSEGLVHYGNDVPTNPYVKLWIKPTDGSDTAVTLAYVNENFVKKITGTDILEVVYAVDLMDRQTMRYIEDHDYFEKGMYVDGCLPKRQHNGNLFTNTPVKDLDCANKKYVDEAVANASGENVDLTGYVKKTDYAITGGTVGGVVKLSAGYCAAADNGVLRSVVRDINAYNAMYNTAFISKGTLENVLAAKCVPVAESNGMTDQAYIVTAFGEQITVAIEENHMYTSVPTNFANSIPRRTDNGNLLTQTPTTDLECANKKYVDDTVLNLTQHIGNVETDVGNLWGTVGNIEALLGGI